MESKKDEIKTPALNQTVRYFVLSQAQTGWIRRVITKKDNCLCLVDKNNQGSRATQFEFASTERTFNMLMLKIATQLTRPLHKSG